MILIHCLPNIFFPNNNRSICSYTVHSIKCVSLKIYILGLCSFWFMIITFIFPKKWRSAKEKTKLKTTQIAILESIQVWRRRAHAGLQQKLESYDNEWDILTKLLSIKMPFGKNCCKNVIVVHLTFCERLKFIRHTTNHEHKRHRLTRLVIIFLHIVCSPDCKSYKRRQYQRVCKSGMNANGMINFGMYFSRCVTLLFCDPSYVHEQSFWNFSEYKKNIVIY